RITGDEWRIFGKEVKVELWVHNAGKEDLKFQILRRTDEGLRVKLTDKDGKEHVARMVPNDVPLFGTKHHLSQKQCIKVNEFSVRLLPPEQSAKIGDELRFFVPPDSYQLVCEVEVPGFTAKRGDGRQTVPGAGEWTGTITTRSKSVEVVAQDAPPPKLRIQWKNVAVGKDGAISLDRKKMTLDELKALAAQHVADWRIAIDADKDVPYAKVVEVMEALKGAGVTDISFSKARVGDGKYRVANRSGSYEFDGKHQFSICRPEEHPQWFTVMWPEEGDRPKCWLRTYPNIGAENGGKWAVVWEPGTDVLWWVDDTDVGKMTLTDPARVIVNREGRINNFSRDFGLPEDVKTEFRKLGFVVGRIGQTGADIGGNTGGQSIVSAEFGNWIIKGTVTDADGKPLADVPVRVRTEFQPTLDTATTKTDAKGEYRVAFQLTLTTLAAFRGVFAEPVLEGFVERDLAKSGEFNALLRAGEKPRRPGDENARYVGPETFAPGPIPRFAERDLLPSQPAVVPGNPGIADFVMLKADEITGEIVTADGKPAPPHWIAAATPEQRRGYNVAIEKSDADGRFRLKGIPPNKPLIFTVNPDGKPGETSKSATQKPGFAKTHRVRMTLPATSGGVVQIKSVADPD
ncbi:MAG: biopolymer transporter ExbD, partial [Chthoniobacteraceae bacterium]